MLTLTSRGTTPIPPRDLAARRKQAGYAPAPIIEGAEAVDVPVGDALMDELEKHYDIGRFARSTALSRYATEHLGIDWRDVLDHVLEGEPLGEVTVKRFLTNTGLKPFFSPVVEDGIRMGLNRGREAWEDLIAQTVRVDGVSYEYYEFNNGTAGASVTGTDEFSLRRVAQGAPIPTARITIGKKSYTLWKVGRGIEWTDEAKQAPIDLAGMWFQQLGLQLSRDYHELVIDQLLNGYFADGSDDAPVLATAGAGVITDADLYTADGTLETVYGYDAKVMVMNLTRSIAIRTMENGAGQRIYEDAQLPPIRLSQHVPSDKVIFVDTDFALVRYVQKEFGTEFDRSPQTQVEGSYGTSVELTVPLFPKARIILDA